MSPPTPADSDHHDVTWFDRGVEPTQPPDPAYPHGIDLDIRARPNRPGCKVALPYPAARCGYYRLTCAVCGQHIMVTTAGRPDDPRSVTMDCLPRV